jgi:hypothetical protein
MSLLLYGYGKGRFPRSPIPKFHHAFGVVDDAASVIVGSG